MSGMHPVDALGRVLPHPGWPDDRQAPGRLELVRRFCNSINRESGGERFAAPGDIDGWLASEGEPGVDATGSGLRRIIAVRDVLHALAVVNAGGPPDPGGWSQLAELLAPTRVGFAVVGPSLVTVPMGDGVDALLGDLGLIVTRSLHDGTWERVKACQRCCWVVYDPSKNGSVRWCSMRACGGRHNAREYRLRKSAHRIAPIVQPDR